ncbi:30S ribosomal protein S8 [Candidatus Parcubacteria bacterium]|nr:MAG: 30S ribosomal protein S8 [Candidatus Parcubacteria bacterium]
MYTDLLAKIKNAELARKESITTPFSKMDFAIAKALAQANYLKDVQKRTIGHKMFIDIKLVYRGGKPGITDFKIMSKPSRRLYVGYRDLRRIKQGYGLAVLSTPKGISVNTDARKAKVGGEYLFEVW